LDPYDGPQHRPPAVLPSSVEAGAHDDDRAMRVPAHLDPNAPAGLPAINVVPARTSGCPRGPCFDAREALSELYQAGRRPARDLRHS